MAQHPSGKTEWRESENGPKQFGFGSCQRSHIDWDGSPDFVPERIATLDNDGTLWAEQSTYYQFSFVLERV